MDDRSPVPLAPSVDVPAVQQDQKADDTETQKLAQAYWHPAWSKVQEYFEDKLASYRTNGAIFHQDLPADEFKIRLLVDAMVANDIEEIMEDVKRAVAEVEAGRSVTTGGK